MKPLLFVTYGDGIANVNMNNLYDFYASTNSIAALTAVRPPARFGSLNLDGNKVEKFNEKNQSNEGWINGGFLRSTNVSVNILKMIICLLNKT